MRASQTSVSPVQYDDQQFHPLSNQQIDFRDGRVQVQRFVTQCVKGWHFQVLSILCCCCCCCCCCLVTVTSRFVAVVVLFCVSQSKLSAGLLFIVEHK